MHSSDWGYGILMIQIAKFTIQVSQFFAMLPTERRAPERGSKRVDVETFEMCNALRISQAPRGLVSTQHQQFVSQSS